MFLQIKRKTKKASHFKHNRWLMIISNNAKIFKVLFLIQSALKHCAQLEIFENMIVKPLSLGHNCADYKIIIAILSLIFAHGKLGLE